MSSPPKPWETNSGVSAVAAAAEGAGGTRVSSSQNNTPPAIPASARPVTDSSIAGNNLYGNRYNNQLGSTVGAGMGYGISGGGMGYGSTGGYGGYGSTYGNTMGGYGSSYGGGGIYGSSYGGGGMYGGGMYGGGGGMYGNRMGMGGGMYGNRPAMIGPNGLPIMDDGSGNLMQRMEQSTQSTFQMLDQIVQAFGGFSQMLESTFFATHSSFMAMMGVADQFSHLRNYLGQVISIMSVYKTVKSLAYRVTGQPQPVDPAQLTVGAFQQELAAKPPPSRRPLFVFLALIVGLPYLMGKLIQTIDRRKKEGAAAAGTDANGQPLPNNTLNNTNAIAHTQSNPTDIRNLEFCKANYDFHTDNPQDLSFKKGELVAVLSKLEDHDPLSEWWSGRTQEGRVGLFPKNYVTLIPRKTVAALPPSPTTPTSNTTSSNNNNTTVDLLSDVAKGTFNT